MKKTFFTLIFSTSLLLSNAQFWQPTEAVVSTGAIVSTVNGSLGNTVFSSGNNGAVYNSFSYSLDQGETWNVVGSILEQGTVGQYIGAGDRLYAALSLVTGDYEYHFSQDNGMTWEVDTIGLPHYYGISTNAKDAFRIKKMGNNHMVAFNGAVINGAYVKDFSQSGWSETTTSEYLTHLDFTYMGDTWYALNPSYSATPLVQSTDFGATWTNIEFNGIPAGFQVSILESNHTNKLYMASGLSDDIYYSTDGGNNWTLTNAGELHDYSTAWISKLYAVDDYVFASLNPEDALNDQFPKFISSSTASPDFSIGDVSGLTESIFVFPILNCFHAGDKFFIMWDDLYSSEPGFSGITTLQETTDQLFSIYPNPCSDAIQFNASERTGWFLTSSTGQLVSNGTANPGFHSIDVQNLPNGIYLLNLNGLTNRVIVQH